MKIEVGKTLDEPDKPKTWGEMDDAEKGALLLARLNGGTVQGFFETDTSVLESWHVWVRDDYMDRIAYRVLKEPVRETVKVNLDINLRIQPSGQEHGVTQSITIPTIDGTPVPGTYTNANGDKIKLDEVAS